ncbi:serpin-ZX-like [Nicotiana sylvestris]|uniref:Serpin-ZX-like n=1 Tax=Nicotiana sylvestris TaxID=4096 RepID=A0A1U7W8J8_NICSY|nr:PREDICTED: serpin-ZX-like [Nicotiana sylvestris]
MDFCSYFSNMSLRESVKKQSDIPWMLAKHVFSSELKGIDSNMVFSPLSIQIVLGLIATGSKGQTMDQLLSFFNLNSIEEVNSLSSWLVANVLVDGSPRGGPRLSVANGAWVDLTLSFKHSFKQIMDNVYKAASAYVYFQNKPLEVAKEVNKWVEEKTNGLIKEILPPGAVHNMTRLILANTLYFKGEWVKKFNASETKDYEFYLLNGTSIKAPFMTKNGFSTVAAA